MSDQEYACYEVRLNRIFNIQSKQNLIWLAVLLGFFASYILISLFNGTLKTTDAIITGLGFAAIMIIRLFSCPKCIDVTPETVRFEKNGLLLNLLLMKRAHFYSDGPSRYKSTFTIYNIESVEYLQSSFEKRFSCGHIRICGEISSNKGKVYQSVTIYGLKDFDNTSAWMRGYLKLRKET